MRSAFQLRRVRVLSPAGLLALLMTAMPAPGHAQTPLHLAAPQSPTQPLSLVESTLPQASVDLPFRIAVQATGGSARSTFSINGTLPPGLTADSGAETLAIGGIPTEAGLYDFQVTVTDLDGRSATRSYSITVGPRLFQPRLAAVPVPVAETIHVTDADLAFFPLVVGVSEPVHVADGDQAFMPRISSVAETIHVADTTSVITKIGVTPTTAPAGTYNSAYSQVFNAVGNIGSATITPGGPGLPFGMGFNTVGGSATLSGTPTQTGSFPFTLTAHDSVNTSVINYTLIINTAAQTISIGTLPTPTYGGANFTLTATASPSSLPVTIASTSALATGSNPFTPVSVGSASFQATQAGNANYSTATPINFNVTIGKAPLTATANSASRVFDQRNPTSFGYSLATFVNGDTSSVVSGSPIINTTATPISPVTTYPINVSLGSLSAANYNIGVAAGTLTVTKAPQTIIFYALPTLAHGNTFPLSARSSSGLVVTYTVTGPATITNSILSVTGTGLVQVTAAQAGNTNYTAATSVIRSFTAQ